MQDLVEINFILAKICLFVFFFTISWGSSFYRIRALVRVNINITDLKVTEHSSRCPKMWSRSESTRVLDELYYSTFALFCHIWSRERAKCEPVMLGSVPV